MANKRLLCDTVSYYRPVLASSGDILWKKSVLRNVRLQTVLSGKKDGISVRNAVLWVFPAVLCGNVGAFSPETGDMFQAGNGGDEPSADAFLVEGAEERRSGGRAFLTHFRITGTGGAV